MINVDMELDRLRIRLVDKGLEHNETNDIISLARQDINGAIDVHMENAISQAKEAGFEMGVKDFSNQVIGFNDPGGVRVGTESGQVDFSLPPFPMLPKLLKNAKVAKDGSLYKVIPMRNNSTPTNIFDAVRKRNTDQKAEVEARNEARESRFAGVNAARSILKNNRKKNDEAVSEFRTASSKQDAGTQWVLPAKDLDMGPVLHEINSKLEENINYSVTEIIGEYERMINEF